MARFLQQELVGDAFKRCAPERFKALTGAIPLVTVTLAARSFFVSYLLLTEI